MRSTPTNALRPFDLERGPAIRFLIIEVPESHWRFVVVAHHILLDGWSLPLFVGELITLYRAGGDVGVLPPPPRPYRDYIGWLAARDQEASRRCGATHLGGLDGPTLVTPALSAGELASGVAATHRTEAGQRRPPPQLAEAARSRGVTVNTLVQMTWAMLLSAFTDRSDVVFGVTVSGRPSELAGVETMVGLFINTVPLRVRLDPAAGVGAQCLALQREAAKLRDHSYLAHAELRSLGGVGEMYRQPAGVRELPARRTGRRRGVHGQRGHLPARIAGEPVALSRSPSPPTWSTIN